MKKALLILMVYFVAASPAVAQTKSDTSPLTYGLVLDHSGSMKDILKYINASATTIINTNAPGDESFISGRMSYKWGLPLLQAGK